MLKPAPRAHFRGMSGILLVALATTDVLGCPDDIDHKVIQEIRPDGRAKVLQEVIEGSDGSRNACGTATSPPCYNPSHGRNPVPRDDVE